MLVLLSLLVTSGHAFAPTDAVHVGVEPQRVRTFHPTTQALLHRTPAWRRLLRTGGDWRARFDEATGTPHRMWGVADIGPTDTEAQVVRGLRDFVGQHADLLGASPKQLAVRNVGHDAGRDTWYVDLDVLLDGHPVYRGGITARIVQGRLVMLGADTYPDVPRTGTATLDRRAAIDAAVSQGPAPGAAHADPDASLVWLPQDHGPLSLRLTWQVTSRTAEPPGRWVSFVDAETGALLSVHNEVRFASGTLTALHDERNPASALVESPLPHARILDGDATVETDADGSFALAGEVGQATLDGPYARIHNHAGDDAVLEVTGDAVFTDADATLAELDTYVFLNRIRDWGAAVAPEVSLIDRGIKATVNRDETCNAYFDGDLHFFSAGDDCNNTGRIADVAFHEWGHAFHYWSLRAGVFDGSLSEGAADVVAFLQTGDSRIAPHFFEDGDGIRDVAPDRVYPDDFSTHEAFVHRNGLIFGGAMWDLWDLMIARHGEQAGTEAVEHLFAGLLKGGPDIATSFDEALLADDDDGDLSNGTPNDCLVMEAFGRHGLGPAGQGSPYAAVHEPRPTRADALDHRLDVELFPLAPTCFDQRPEQASVTWRVDGGDWETTPLSVSGNTARGAIPKQADGAFVEYYVTMVDDEGATRRAPEGGFVNPFGFYVGDVLRIHCDDFEDEDSGWAPDDRLGEHDWQWGRPAGRGGDPPQAASGSRVWGTDLGLDGGDGRYDHEWRTRLRSPVLETGHHQGVFLAYQRWLGVEDGFYDDARIRADEDIVWENHGSGARGEEHHLDAQWVPHVVPLGGAADDGRVEIAFELDPDQGLAFGGWTIDDVCLMAPATPDNRLGISDLVATRGDDGVRLTWTNPRHAPLDRVRVVRTRGRLPDGPDDGDVVFDDPSPVVGTEAAVLDDAPGRRPHYAVYAHDGRQWLSFTVDGWNAAAPEVRAGCATLPGPGAGWLAGLALLALRRRR